MKTLFSTIVGSRLYGFNTDASDYDYKGFGLPEIDELLGLKNWEQSLFKDETKKEEGTIFALKKFVNLSLHGNPTILEVNFTRTEFTRETTSLGEEIRTFLKKEALTKQAYFAYKAYFYSQVKKLERPEREGKRQNLIDQYGYDCFSEENTEFLTDSGWKKYNQVLPSDLLGTIHPKTHQIEFQNFLGRISKLYTGKLFELKSYLTKCEITSGHRLFLSSCHRAPSRKYSTEYNKASASWDFINLDDYLKGKRSFYHIVRHPLNSNLDFPIDDDYLKIAGLFVSEGTLEFRDNKVKNAKITQTKNGKIQVFKELNNLGFKEHVYEKESVWILGRKIAESLYKDFGHGSLKKRLPDWTLKLSKRQADIFWKFLWLGDGTPSPNGDVYYSSNKDLVGDIQAMMICAGNCCSVRGPYKSISSFNGKEIISYQVYLNKDSVQYYPISKQNFKSIDVLNYRVCCFSVQNGTLITRNSGKVSIQGNCKFACHAWRLARQCKEILTTGTFNPTMKGSDLEFCKEIRAGKPDLPSLLSTLKFEGEQLENYFTWSNLPDKPDFNKCNEWLRDIQLKYVKGEYGL